jgi:hypothetical protein
MLRATFVKSVRDEESGLMRDLWIWFVAREGEDCWMSFGLSNECTSLEAGAMTAELSEPQIGFDMDIYISYLGEPWTVIDTAPVPHAQMQRDYVQKLEAVPSEMERLRRLSRSEIEAERLKQEREFLARRKES